jgi:DNA-binding transcriptional MerR regulator
MRKPLSQIPLEFGGEEKDPSPAPDANGSTSQREGGYLATAGVGIRVKSFKKPTPPEAGGEMFQAREIPAAPDSAKAEPTPVLEVQPTPVAEIPPAPVAEGQSTPIAEVPPTPGAEAQTANSERATRRKPAAMATPSKRGRKSLKQGTAEADLIEIPADEVLFAKQYYTMGEVSVMFKVNQSLLRYWETEFDILQPRKNKKGDRYFRPVDIKNLHLIYHLLRQRKYTIEGAKDFLRNNKKAKERFEIIERLQQIRNFLLEWKAQL